MLLPPCDLFEHVELPPFRLRVERHCLQMKQALRTTRALMREQLVFYVYCEHELGCGVGEACPIPMLSEEYSNDFELKLRAACAETQRASALRVGDYAHQSSIRFALEGALLSSLPIPPWSLAAAEVPIHHLIWWGDDAFMLSQLARGAEQGFTCFKMRVGARSWADDLSFLRQVRERYPHHELRVDANGTWKFEGAMEKIDALATLGVASLEQPLAVGQGGVLTKMAALIAASPVPIALDEELMTCHCFDERERLMDVLMPDAVVVKPSLHGGLLAAAQWQRLAEERGVACWLNSYLESNVGLECLARWAATYMPGSLQGLGTGLLYENNRDTGLYLRPPKLFLNKITPSIVTTY